MNCHEFNIGTEEALKEEYRNKNLLNDWWTYLLKQNVITLGFDSEIGDRGTYLLGTKLEKVIGFLHMPMGMDLLEWDWLMDLTNFKENYHQIIYRHTIIIGVLDGFIMLNL